MPNLKADASGNAAVAFERTRMTMGEGRFSIVSNLIVHRDPDD
jgi:Cu/Zn superoxide dismutase